MQMEDSQQDLQQSEWQDDSKIYSQSQTLLTDLFQSVQLPEFVAAMEKRLGDLTNFYKTEQASAGKILQESANKSQVLEAQNKELLKNIAKMKKKVSKQQEEIKLLVKSRDNNAQQNQELKSSLTAARKHYQKLFGLDVQVLEGKENDFVATLLVKEKKFPIKFTMDNSNSTIIDFDASKIVDREQHMKLKTIFSQTQDISGLIAYLRQQALRKCKSF